MNSEKQPQVITPIVCCYDCNWRGRKEMLGQELSDSLPEAWIYSCPKCLSENIAPPPSQHFIE